MSSQDSAVVTEKLIELVCELKRLDTKGNVDRDQAEWFSQELAPIYELGRVDILVDDRAYKSLGVKRVREHSHAPSDGAICQMNKNSNRGGQLVMQKNKLRVPVLLREFAILQMLQGGYPVQFEDCAEFGKHYWDRLQKDARARQQQYNQEYAELIAMLDDSVDPQHNGDAPLLSWGPVSALRQRMHEAGLV